MRVIAPGSTESTVFSSTGVIHTSQRMEQSTRKLGGSNIHRREIVVEQAIFFLVNHLDQATKGDHFVKQVACTFHNGCPGNDLVAGDIIA